MGTLESIAGHLVLALEPLKTAVSSPDAFRQFLYRLGWTATDLPPAYAALAGKVDDALTALQGLLSSPDPEKALEVIGKVKVVVDAIEAVAEAPPGIGAVQTFLDEIKERLFELLLTDYLAAEVPQVFNLLRTTGVIEPVPFPSGTGRPSYIRWKIDWDKIPEVVAHPDELPKIVYGWGTPDLDTDKLFHHLMELLYTLDLPVSLLKVDADTSSGYLQTDPQDPFAPVVDRAIQVPFAYLNIGGDDQLIGLAILPLPQENGKLPGIIIQPAMPSAIGATLRIREDVMLRIEAGSNIAAQFGLVIRPGEIAVRYPFQGGTLPDFGFGIGVDYSPTDPTLLLGSAGSSRLQIVGASADFTFRFTQAEPELIMGADLKGLALLLQAGESNGFMRSLLGDGETSIEFPLGVEWSSKSGLRFKGGGGFEVAVSPHLHLGPITIDKLLIRLVGETGTPSSVRLTVGADMKGELGPLTFVIQNTGVVFQAKFAKGGNVGPFDLSLGFKPPDGVGLAVHSGLVSGGGFLSFDPVKGEYVGAMELEFQGLFTLKAVGVIDTKMPDGSNGFSLLIVITAEFQPVQLGLGFALVGVGGLLGLNRTSKVDVLRQGIKTNTLQSILFPTDVIANIDRIVSDLSQVFPPLTGRFIFGPMAEITWGTSSLLTLELGLLLEIPNPRILILGVLKALLPQDDDQILRIQVNFLGVIDFENKYISFDASLFDSRLLVYTLTGDMAFRLSWGDHPLFLLSVGGFHPAYKDAPGDLQHMVRMTISLLSGENPRITVQCYFAVTSNTVQFGAKAELYAAAGGFNIYGFVGYDVLFQLRPFHFVADLNAGMALRRGSSVLMSIQVHGELSGPRPMDLQGTASISLFFFDISVSFHVTWGDPLGDLVALASDLVALLTAELKDARNWKADLPDINNLRVSVKKFDPPAESVVVHPAGTLQLSQRLLPLNVSIDKFGESKPTDVNRFEITDVRSGATVLVTQPATEEYARANFFTMTDSEKLSSPSFEQMQSGFRVSASSDLVTGTPVSLDVDYELSYLRPSRFSVVRGGRYLLAKSLFFTGTRSAAVARSPLAARRRRASPNAPDGVALPSEQYVIANVSDLTLHAPGMIAGSYTEATDLLRQIVTEKPELRNQILVVSTYEVDAA